MKSLSKQVVLITGAGGGLGQEMVRQLLGRGCYLILADMRAEMMVRAAERAGGGTGRVLGFVEADLATPEGADELFRRCQAIAPAVDVLVNNAGTALSGDFVAVPQPRWERLMQVNLLAPMRLTALFLAGMLERRSGHIVNVSSAAGLVGAAGLVPYCTAKFGLRGFTEALHADLAGSGVDVTGIYPFFTRTPILQSDRFGPTPTPALPGWSLYEADFVVAQLIAGMEQRRLHVYPGVIPQAIRLLRRVRG